MNNNPFETIQKWLGKQEMTPQEKRRMKDALISYATNHPVRSGLLSPYAFRYATLAMASLLIVLGGSVGITSAAQSSLPNQKLYPVKIWIEEFQAKNQKTPDAIIAFETSRITKRFNEATELAIKHQLDNTTSQIIQSGLEHSRGTIKDVADTIQNQNPELALAATNTLETTFSSNGKILASIEKNTNENIGTIVLAAQVTTDKLATEKVKFENIVALKPNDTTKAAATDKLAAVSAKLAALQASLPAKADVIPTPLEASTTASTETPVIPATLTASTPPKIAPAETTTAVPSAATILTATAIAPAITSPADNAQALVDQAKRKMNIGLYSEALVALQKASQILDEASLTKTLETTYKVQVSDTVTPPEAPAAETPAATEPTQTEPAPTPVETPAATVSLPAKTAIKASSAISEKASVTSLTTLKR